MPGSGVSKDPNARERPGPIEMKDHDGYKKGRKK
jgi:hypothetical protein